MNLSNLMAYVFTIILHNTNFSFQDSANNEQEYNEDASNSTMDISKLVSQEDTYFTSKDASTTEVSDPKTFREAGTSSSSKAADTHKEFMSACTCSASSKFVAVPDNFPRQNLQPFPLSL